MEQPAIEAVSFTPEQLEAFAGEHVTYEVESVAHGAAMWYLSPPLLSGPARAALMIATLVHLRLLDDFFGRSKRGSMSESAPGGEARIVANDDVLAVDYLPDWSTELVLDRRVRHAINAQVAHLSMERATKREWDIVPLAMRVLRRCDLFFARIQTDAPRYEEAFSDAAKVTREFFFWTS